MGLFDSIASQALGALTGAAGGNANGGNAGLMDVVTQLIGGQGGLQGLVAQFQQGGLGDVVASWVGTGANLPISGEQIQAVLGNEQVQAIASQLGLPLGDAATALAGFLPGAIDKVTPTGAIPSDDMVQQGLSLLKGLSSLG